MTLHRPTRSALVVAGLFVLALGLLAAHWLGFLFGHGDRADRAAHRLWDSKEPAAYSFDYAACSGMCQLCPVHVTVRDGSVAEAVAQLRKAGLDTRLVVDCSHGNTQKRHELQEAVWKNIVEQKAAGNHSLIGAMVESNLFGGNQKIPGDRSQLRYGVSMTDECISWDVTERMLLDAHAILSGAAVAA